MINNPVSQAIKGVICFGVLLMGAMGCCCAQGVPAQGAPVQGVPEAAKKAAAAATKLLGDQVLRTNYSYVIQRMYPRHKARAAKKAGGEAKLAEQLARLSEKMKSQGIVILTFAVGEPKSAFLVPEYKEWLVFVPTKKVYTLPDPQRGNAYRKIESHGYQVAVAKEGGQDWYFMDGSNLTVQQLRSMFPSLPKDVKLLSLPRVEQKEIK